MKKIERTMIAGMGLCAVAVVAAAINIFNPATPLGAPYLPSYKLPFITNDRVNYGVPASEDNTLQLRAAYGCALDFTTQAGFPFTTNRYGYCGDSESGLAITLNWAIVVLLALGSAMLVAGSFGNLSRLLTRLGRRLGNIPAYIGLTAAVTLIVLQQSGQLADQLHIFTNYWLPGLMASAGVVGWRLSRTRLLKRTSLAVLGLGVLLIAIALYAYGV